MNELKMVGTTVYLRDANGVATNRRGKITSVSGTDVTVKWDDGQNQLMTIRSLISEAQVQKEAHDKKLKEMAMKVEDCTIGTVVYFVGGASPRKAKIAGVTSKHPTAGDVVIVEWDGGGLDKVVIAKLLNEVDGKAEQDRLEAEAQKLEEEFEKVQKACKDKLQKAAELINEAAKVAEAHGQDLMDMYEAVRPLERAMDNAGWRTSSWHC